MEKADATGKKTRQRKGKRNTERPFDRKYRWKDPTEDGNGVWRFDNRFSSQRNAVYYATNCLPRLWLSSAHSCSHKWRAKCSLWMLLLLQEGSMIASYGLLKPGNGDFPDTRCLSSSFSTNKLKTMSLILVYQWLDHTGPNISGWWWLEDVLSSIFDIFRG